MTNPPDREAAIFGAALRLPSRERAAYLDEACGDNLGLRQRIEELLQASDEAGNFLESPANVPPSGTIPAMPTEKPGDRIGRYKLLQQIGEGGCGVVYMAEQEEPVHRRVALKVIKLGMDTKQVIARFEAERQALALMDHPNIAKVLDAGATDAGRPYFVMELVRGIKITDYCDQHGLSTRERLDLFIQVCRAIQHAHQKGVIHRDIKPSNILVTLDDGVPLPKVIDFGIAKATEGKLTDQTVFTAFEQFIGTPAYMSPEQAEMSARDVDTRSDIYSLGILLYELLTGQTPFDTKKLLQAGLDEIRRTIREVEPPKPSARLTQELVAADVRRPHSKSEVRDPKSEEEVRASSRRLLQVKELIHVLRGDLDWIVMKCLEKDRGRRYETANGLAADIKRHLNTEPVLARPPSKLYEFQKTVRRHKFGFAATAAIMIVLAIGVLVSGWQARRALQAEAAAKERLAESQAVSKFMIGVFQSPDPARNGRTITVAETLDRAVTNLDRDLAAQPALRAQLQDTLGSTYSALGLNREAASLAEKVYEYYLKNLGMENTNTIRAMATLAESYRVEGRQDETLKLCERVLALDRKVLGPEHPDTLAAMGYLAGIYATAGRNEEALKLREQVLALDQKVLGPEHPATLRDMQMLSNSYGISGRKDEELNLREQVLALSRKVSGPEHPDTLWAIYGVACAYWDAGRTNEALKLFEQVLALRRKVSGPEHPDTLYATGYLADFYAKAGRNEEALKLREQVLALDQKVLGPEHPVTRSVMQNLANSYDAAGRKDEALKLREEVLTLDRKVLGPENPATLWAINNLAWMLATSDFATIRNGTNAVQLAETAVAATSRTNWSFLDTLAAAYAETQQFDKATAAEREAIGLLNTGPEKTNCVSRLNLYLANKPYREQNTP